jgi:hypothetical protein
MSPTGVLLLALATIAPQAEGGSDPRAAEGWRSLDGVVAHVGDEVITRGELDRFVQRRTGGLVLSTPEEVQDVREEALRGMITLRLQAQAGEDMGFDPAEMDRIVRRSIEAQRRELGSAGLAELWLEQGLDPLAAREDQMSDLYQQIWRIKTVGLPGPAGTRPTRDRFVRPGDLESLYRVNRDELGDPDEVQLQLLDVLAAAEGGLEKARERCEECRRMLVEDGADFGQMVEKYGASLRSTLGVTEALIVPRLADPRLREFAAGAETGEVSEILPLEGPEGLEGYRLVRLHSRREGAPPLPFSDPRTQNVLRREYLRQREERVLDEARDRLQRRAHVWLNPAFVETRANASAPPSAASR